MTSHSSSLVSNYILKGDQETTAQILGSELAWL